MYLTHYLVMFELDTEHALLINALSGAVDVIDTSTRAMLKGLKNGEGAEIPAEVRATLQQRLYLFDSAVDEERHLSKLLNASVKYSTYRPVSFIVCPTYQCNMRCVYCYEGDIRSDDRVMTMEQVASVFAAINQLRIPNRAHMLHLFGGEPIQPSTKDVISDILARAAEINLPVKITTNGVHLQDFADLWYTYKEHIDSMQITLDGPSDIHNQRRILGGGGDSFEAIVQGIDLVLSCNIRVGLRINVDAQNLPYLPQMMDFILDKEWTRHPAFFCDAAPVTDHPQSGRVPNILPEHEIVARLQTIQKQHPLLGNIIQFRMFRVLGHIHAVFNRKQVDSGPAFKYCEANHDGYYVFGVDNKLYICPEAIGNEGMAIGEFHPSLEMNRTLIQEWSQRSILTIPKCQKCEVAPFCGGGCAYAAWRANGSIYEPVCDDAPNVLETYVDSIKDQILAQYD